MKAKASIGFIFFAYYLSAQVFSLSPNFWNDFSGTLGDQEIFLTLYAYENGEVIGTYVLQEYDIQVPLKGHLEGDNLILTGTNSSVFSGKLSTDQTDNYTGAFTKGVKETPVNFRLKLSTICWGLPKKRYADMHGSDEEVHEYAQKVKDAILSGNKSWIADQLSFPLIVHVNGEKITIQSRSIFIEKYFDLVFHDQFLKTLKTFRTTHLFTSNSGLMLGKGQIWIFSSLTCIRYKSDQPRYFLDWLST